MRKGGKRKDKGVFAAQGPWPRKNALSLKLSQSGDSSKASAGGGTQEPRDLEHPTPRPLSLSPPPPCAPTGAASRRQPPGSPCFLPLSRGRCYTHRLLPQPPAWAPCLPGRPFTLLPPSYHPRGVPQPRPPFRLPPLPTVSAAPTAPALPQPSPPPDPAPRGNGVRPYPGHRRRWSAPRWPSRCPRGSRRTSAGDPWRCRGGYGGRDGARSPREPLAAGLCSALLPESTLRWIEYLVSAERNPEKKRCRCVFTVIFL